MNQSTKSLFVINAALYSVYAVGAFFLIPTFESLFKSFEVELEGASLLIINTYQFWLVFPAFFIGTLVYFNGKVITPMTKNVLFYTGVFFIVFGIFFITIITGVIYSVIFSMSTQ